MVQAVRVLFIAFLIATAPVAISSSAPVEASSPTARFVPLDPARVADTRDETCGCSRPTEQTIRVDLDSLVPAAETGELVAAALTITALPTGFGFVTAYPGHTRRPTISAVNTRPDRVVATSTIVPVGSGGTVDVYSSTGGDVAIDVTGVFVAAAEASDGRFEAVTATRALDTRSDGAPRPPRSVHTVDVSGHDASAVAINVTHVGSGAPGYVGLAGSGTSLLNTTGHGPVASMVVVPVTDGVVKLYDHAGGHLLVDVVGIFTGPDAEVSGDGLFVPVDPRRLLDTRSDGPRLYAGSSRVVESPWPESSALVTTLTATAPDRPGFVTAGPAGSPTTATSSVNPAGFDHTVSNLAITPTGNDGILYGSKYGVDLVVDVTGRFTGAPRPGNAGYVSTDYQPPRVLMIGDSGLRGVEIYAESQAAFREFETVIDAAGCRRLSGVSCISPSQSTAPPNALEAIATAGTGFEYVVVTAGHNDGYNFVEGFDAVVSAARNTGAHTIIWQNYSAVAPYDFIAENSATIDSLLATGRYPDVVLADWRSYTAGPGRAWLWDGIHMTPTGAWGQTDYLARWIAYREHRPCPDITAARPRPDSLVAPCPNPDRAPPPADPKALWHLDDWPSLPLQ